MNFIVICYLTFGSGFLGARIAQENVVVSSEAVCKREANRLGGFGFVRNYDSNHPRESMFIIRDCGVNAQDCRKVEK